MPFVQPIAPVLAGHPPEARESERGRQVAHVDVAVTITFPRKGEDGIGTGIHFAGDAPREVDPEKREARVRHRIDQRAYQRSALGHQVVVLSAERNDHHAGVVACHMADAVAEQSRAIDE